MCIWARTSLKQRPADSKHGLNAAAPGSTGDCERTDAPTLLQELQRKGSCPTLAMPLAPMPTLRGQDRLMFAPHIVLRDRSGSYWDTANVAEGHARSTAAAAHRAGYFPVELARRARTNNPLDTTQMLFKELQGAVRLTVKLHATPSRTYCMP